MQDKTNPILFDRDNLKEVFRGWRQKELLNKHGYKTLTELYQALIRNKAPGSEYIVGLPGAGKTSFALHDFGAQAITQENIHTVLTMEFDRMVFVSCEVEDEIASKAKRITMVHSPSSRIGQQRKQRDEDIQEGEAETAFGRSAGTVAKVTTDPSIVISRLKTDYADKSRIMMYSSKDPKNFDERKEFHVSKLSDKKKYIERGVVTASGKWSPAQIVHIQNQLQHVLSLAQEKGLDAFAILGQSSGDDYDLGLTQRERIQIMDLVLKGKLRFVTSGIPKFIKNDEGQVIKIDPKRSWAVLGKERLPVGFTQGSYQEIVQKYPDFVKSRDANVLKFFKDYNFINIGDVAMPGSDESISATFVRKNLVEGNIDAVKPYLSPEIFSALISEHNLAALKRRSILIQARDAEIWGVTDQLTKKYKYADPISGLPLGNDKKGEPVVLNKRHANAHKDRRSYAKVMTYLEDVDEKIKKAERKIKKKYGKLIYSEENGLELNDGLSNNVKCPSSS